MRRKRFPLSAVFAFLICVTFAPGQVGHPPVLTPPGKVNAPPNQPRYDGGMVVENPQARVSNATDLLKALNDAASAKFRCERHYVIWVEDNASIRLDDIRGGISSDAPGIVQIPSCVTLASGRSATVDGGLIYLVNAINAPAHAISMGAGSRITGLRLQGPYGGADTGQAAVGAILVGTIAQALIDNNEIFNWPRAAVEIAGSTNTRDTALQIEVRGNFIHDDVMCGLGYGVTIGTSGYATVDQNLFDYNRHAIADDGCVTGMPECSGNTGYIATLNFIMWGGRTCPSSGVLGDLAAYYNQHMDVHGSGSGCGSIDHCGGKAGEYFDISYNTIRGAQEYDFIKIRPALMLRGTPVVGAYFHNNTLEHSNQGDAISTPANNPQPNLFISANEYATNTAGELAVGDFDGDGYADVFQATGQSWWYAPRGQREWRYLNTSSIRLSGLAFGDFDGDGKTDVFSQEGDQWLVSFGGTSKWTKLPAGSSIPMSNYAFVDIDGDGKTDILESNGVEWFYSSGGATPWTHLNYSKINIKDCRFGHFNPHNPKEMDVFAIVNGQWSISLGGRSKWQKLNDNLEGDINKLVFADFNRDGMTDIAYGDGVPLTTNKIYVDPHGPGSPVNWYVSYSGRHPWRLLNSWTAPPGEGVAPLTGMLIGDFNGDHGADVLMPWLTNFSVPPSDDSHISFVWFNGGTGPFTARSTYVVQ